MSKEPKVFIEHILESIELIIDYTRDISKHDFLTSKEKKRIAGDINILLETLLKVW
ncbi:MAG: hypothetical protein PWR10_1058 [Halanaerobiales bacterium]|nr:hypothetical protein [Halanaerobiales bacterium]